MNLAHMRYAMAVWRLGHYRKAAEACFVEQPTISIGVMKLEQELGVQLFHRNRAKGEAKWEVIATFEGRRYLYQMDIILAEVEKLKAFSAVQITS